MIFFSMLILGALIGFVGAGGAGVVITLLTVGFGVPIHTALGVALASMLFTMLSGAISHFREGEVVVKTGAVLGAGGVIGALLGAEVSNVMPSEELGFLTALMLLLSAFTLYMKVYRAEFLDRCFHVRGELLAGKRLVVYGLSLGFVNGFLSGAFGIGAAAFIQLTLLCVFGVPLLQSIGTCMMVILPISAAGGLGYMLHPDAFRPNARGFRRSKMHAPRAASAAEGGHRGNADHRRLGHAAVPLKDRRLFAGSRESGDFSSLS